MTRRQKDDYIEISLSSSRKDPVTLEILREILAHLGILPEDIAESHIGVHCKVSAYLRSLRQVRRIKEAFRRLHLKDVFLRWKEIKAKDWKHKWKVAFRPFALTKGLDVVPETFKKSYKPTVRVPIYIETGYAFGSGMHETTQFTAWLIERCGGKFKSFLDVGTGSGILSLVALKNYGERVYGLDVDPLCVRAARKNLRRNGYAFQETYVADVGTWHEKKKFDFVAANLITQELIRVKKILVSLVKPGKYLAISGIMEENLETVKRAYRVLPVRCLKIHKGRQWVALLYQKRFSDLRIIH